MDPSKLMKEVSLGAQTDLVLLKEVGVLTDGSYAKRRSGSEEYIMTYSVPQMTDIVAMVTVSTQTSIPRLPGDVILEAYTKLKIPSDQKLSETEKQILKQLTKLRKSVIPLSAQFEENNIFVESCMKYDDKNTSLTDTDTDSTTDTIRSIASKSTTAKSAMGLNTYHPNLLYPTELSWHFEYDDDFINYSKSFSTYTITARKPWNSFMPLSKSQHHLIDLNYLLLDIDELIIESNRLINLIEGMMKQRKKTADYILLDADIYNTNEFVSTVYKSPSDFWIPIIEEQEKGLAELMLFKGTDVIKLETYIESK